MLAAAAAKLMFLDIADGFAWDLGETGGMVLANWQFAAGLAAAAMGLAFGLCFARRFADGRSPRTIRAVAILAAAVLVVWMGSYEIHRYFDQVPAEATANAAQAEQMAYSVWWCVWAALLLVAGFAARYVPIRWLALTLFAITIGKVLLVDTADIGAGYRIASFMALGTLLLGGSLLYQRFYRESVKG